MNLPNPYALPCELSIKKWIYGLINIFKPVDTQIYVYRTLQLNIFSSLADQHMHVFYRRLILNIMHTK